MSKRSIRVTLTTVCGAVGTAQFGADDKLGDMSWSREAELETGEVMFALIGKDGSVEEVFAIDGDDWRQIESEGDITDVPLLVRFGRGLQEAIACAIEGMWPADFDGDLAREVDDLTRLVRRMSAFVPAYGEGWPLLEEAQPYLDAPKVQGSADPWHLFRVELANGVTYLASAQSGSIDKARELAEAAALDGTDEDTEVTHSKLLAANCGQDVFVLIDD